jgi:hypothetical protein
VVDQDSPHDLSRDGEEVRPALPLDLAGAGESQVGLVYQGSRLQGVVGAFFCEKAFGGAAQFAVYQAQDAALRVGVALAHLQEQLS